MTPPLPAAARGRILIIDDEADLVSGMKLLLESEGYEVVVQSSPIGLAFLLRRFDPDVVLLDLTIPTLGGEALLRLERKKIFPTNATVILYSGRGREELATLTETHGVDGFFSKGDDLDDLLLRIPVWVECRRGRDHFAAGRRGVSGSGSALQPVIIMRTDDRQSATSAMLQLGGYVVLKAASDDLAAALALSCSASAVVADLAPREASRFAATLENVTVPTLFISAAVPGTSRAVAPVDALRRTSMRHELIATVDRLVCDGETVRRARFEGRADERGRVAQAAQ